MKEEYPERADIVNLVIFAYQKTQQPPVIINEKTGEYEFEPEVVPEENVMVRIAPLASVYSKDFMDKQYNAAVRDSILGWSSLGAKLSVWNYNIGFGAYMYPMYNFHTIQANYRIFKDAGVIDVLDQGARDTEATPFCALRNFIGAELLWNIDLDMSQLIDEFMEHYYKQVAPYMFEYFNYVNAHYKLMEKTRGFYAYAGAWESRDTAIERYFPKEFVLGSLDIFKKAYAVIEKIEESALRELLLNRVGTEELSPRFIMLDLYRNDYEPQERKKLICMFREDAERLGLKHFREDSQRPEEFKFTIAQKTEQWLKEIEQ